MLKHGTNVEILKTWFSMKCQAKKYNFRELKYFFPNQTHIARISFEFLEKHGSTVDSMFVLLLKPAEML